MEHTAPRVMDEVNRATWRDKSNVHWFAKLEGWTDAGERAAVEHVALEVHDQPILDLGVGAGRTVPLLQDLSSDYTGIDYTPEMVAACQRKYPGMRVLLGDARDLSVFGPETFKLVVFSFNGIDAVNPEDRGLVLREVYRVLRNGGIFLFSAHNQRGPGHGEQMTLGVDAARNPAKLFVRAVRALKNAPEALRNYQRYSRLNEEHDGYSIMNAAAHRHGLLLHYVTLEKQCEELSNAGFLPNPAIYENVHGWRVESGDDTSQAWWLHYIARKP
jgi:SAM-dependent methyltransferase